MTQSLTLLTALVTQLTLQQHSELSSSSPSYFVRLRRHPGRSDYGRAGDFSVYTLFFSLLRMHAIITTDHHTLP